MKVEKPNVGKVGPTMTPKTPKASTPKGTETKAVTPQDGFKGTNRLIFKGNKKKIEKLLSKYNAGEIVENLGNDWFVADVNPEKLPLIFSSAPKDVKVFHDEKVELIKPIELQRPPESKKVSKPEPKPIMVNVANQVVNVDKVWKEFGLTGKGIVIAVVDTGIYPHEDLKDRITHFYDATVDKEVPPKDGNGHGTHVAGIAAGSGEASEGKIKGAAYDAEIWGVKVLKDNGYGSFSDVIRGINHVVEMAKKTGKTVVMNLSLGGRAYRPWTDDPVALAIQEAAKAGVIPVIAAGNEGPRPGTVATPGIAPDAITVAALDTKKTVTMKDDDIAKFSSRGPVTNAPDEESKHKPDVAAPGVKIWAPNAPGSEIDQSPWVEHSPDRKYVALSGTSMATPRVAGASALVAQAVLQVNPDISKQDLVGIVREALEKTAKPLEKEDPTDHKPYNDYDQGSGVIDAYAAVKYAMERAKELKEVA